MRYAAKPGTTHANANPASTRERRARGREYPGRGLDASARPAYGGTRRNLRVTGQSNDCAWLRIEIDGGAVGWISGSPAYTSLDQPCTVLAVVAATPTPRPSATIAARRQGCATATNFLGFSIRIDIVRNNGWQTNFTLAPNASRYACIDAGVYTATLSAPSRTDRFSMPLFVRGGENYNIPLQMP